MGVRIRCRFSVVIKRRSYLRFLLWLRLHNLCCTFQEQTGCQRERECLGGTVSGKSIKLFQIVYLWVFNNRSISPEVKIISDQSETYVENSPIWSLNANLRTLYPMVILKKSISHLSNTIKPRKTHLHRVPDPLHPRPQHKKTINYRGNRSKKIPFMC